MKKLCIVLAVLLSSNVNAEWGEQWGSMVWGQSSANVPMMGGVGQFIFFGLLLVIGVFVTKRWGLMKTLPAVAVLSLIPLIVEADEIQLNTFQNGEVANADDVNENFQALSNVLSSQIPYVFSNGSVADADEINANFQALSNDITSCLNTLDNFQSDCENNGGTWNAIGKFCEASPCDITINDAAIAIENFNAGAASVDITIDNAAAFSAGVASVDISENDQSVCESALGIWDVNGITCNPGILSRDYVLFNQSVVGPYVNVSDFDLSGADISSASLVGVFGQLQSPPTVLPQGYVIIRNYFVGPNVSLAGVDMSGENFDGVNLDGANLSGANFSNVTGNIAGIPSVLPNGIALANGYFVGPNSDLSGLDLSGSDLSLADLNGVHGQLGLSENIILPSGYILANDYIVGPGVRLDDADLNGTDLSLASLTGVSGRLLTMPHVLPNGYQSLNNFIVGPGAVFPSSYSGATAGLHCAIYNFNYQLELCQNASWINQYTGEPLEIDWTAIEEWDPATGPPPDYFYAHDLNNQASGHTCREFSYQQQPTSQTWNSSGSINSAGPSYYAALTSTCYDTSDVSYLGTAGSGTWTCNTKACDFSCAFSGGNCTFNTTENVEFVDAGCAGNGLCTLNASSSVQYIDFCGASTDLILNYSSNETNRDNVCYRVQQNYIGN